MKTANVLTSATVIAFVMSGAAQSREYSLQNAFPKNMIISGESADYFADQVRKATNGEIDFTNYGAGELSPPSEIIDNVGSGALDAGWTFPAYSAAKIPAATLFGGMPFGPDPLKYLSWVNHGGGLEIWRELYAPYNIVPLPCMAVPGEAGGWFKKPINSVSDLDGLRMRMSGLGGKVLGKLGVSAQALPVSEIYTSLETGRLDASELSIPQIDAMFGFEKIASHYYFPGWHQPSGLQELVVNRDVWDSWTEDQRSMVDMACKATALEYLMRHVSVQHESLSAFADAGVEIQTFPEDVMKALNTAATEVFAEESEKDPDFKRVYESYLAFSKNYDAYQERNKLD